MSYENRKKEYNRILRLKLAMPDCLAEEFGKSEKVAKKNVKASTEKADKDVKVEGVKDGS